MTRLFSLWAGSLDGNGTGVYAGEEHLGTHVVRGYRKLYEGSSGKDDKADTVFLQFVRKAGNGQLGPLQPVGGIVLGQHGVGDIQGHDDLCPAAGMFGQFGSGTGPRQADDKKREGKAPEGYPHPSLGTGTGRHEGLCEGRVPEGFHPAAAKVSQHSVSQQNHRDQKEQGQVLGVGKHQHHGILLKNAPSSSSSSRQARAASA